MYIWKYKYNNIEYNTYDEMININGTLSPKGVDRDFENMIAYYIYVDYSQSHIDKVNLDILQQELNDIKQWMKDTDYMVLKVLRGNWLDTDIRYTTYLTEYDIKHTRKEGLEELLRV